MKTVKDAFKYRRFARRSLSTKIFMKGFNHAPHNSVTALLRKAGPFKTARDAYRFTNTGWEITEEDARVLREHFQGLVDKVAAIGIDVLRGRLTALSFKVKVPVISDIPVVGDVVEFVLKTMSLPDEAVSFVINEVTEDLRNQLLDSVLAAIPGAYGRCGGMAFSGYDFFLIGSPVDHFGDEQPESGDLRQYIWNRLLDSLELNALTFFEWIMLLHILPIVSRIASTALGVAAGSVVGGPLGAAIGGFLAGKDDVLGIGGVDALADKTREHWKRLRARLDQEAAWPIGIVHGGSFNPIDQHQVLAIGYVHNNNNTAVLTIWDNNLIYENSNPKSKTLHLRFSNNEIFVNCPDDPDLDDIKGIICEEYSFHMPPESLRKINF